MTVPYPLTYEKGFKTARLRIDAGDLVYSLLFCRVLKTKNILVGTNDKIEPHINNKGACCLGGKFSQKTLEFMTPLIKRQSPNFESIQFYDSQDYDFDYGEFYHSMPPVAGTNLTKWHSEKFNINWEALSEPWIVADKNKALEDRILINKTTRYTIHKNDAYRKVLEHNSGKCVFIGTEGDHTSFKKEYECDIEFFDSKDALDMASAINSCSLFVGNSSLCAAIAIGLGKQSWVEVNTINNYIFINNYTKFFS